jgi:hypothetical protein
MRRWAPSAVACLILGGSCRGAPEPAEPVTRLRAGALRISVSMTGEDVPATFTATVAGQSAVRAMAGSVSGSVIVDSLPPGDYSLVLGVALNCTVNGGNPVSVTVIAGETAAIVVPVACVVATGTLRVTTVTTGVDLDPNGYRSASTAIPRPEPRSSRSGPSTPTRQ